MKMRTLSPKTLSAAAVSGAALLLVTAWLPSRSQSVSKPDTPLKVALVLDCITQPRFQDDMKNFGMSRMFPTAGGHLAMGHMYLSNPKEQALYKEATDSNRDFVIGFFHCTHVPGSLKPGGAVPATHRAGTFGGADGKGEGNREPAEFISAIQGNLRHMFATKAPDAVNPEVALYREMALASQKALPKLLKGQDVEQASKDWLVVMRPVRAMKDSCLKCHQGAKRGATLGVLTYAVSKQVFPPVAATPSIKSSF